MAFQIYSMSDFQSSLSYEQSHDEEWSRTHHALSEWNRKSSSRLEICPFSLRSRGWLRPLRQSLCKSSPVDVRCLCMCMGRWPVTSGGAAAMYRACWAMQKRKCIPFCASECFENTVVAIGVHVCRRLEPSLEPSPEPRLEQSLEPLVVTTSLEPTLEPKLLSFFLAFVF